MAIKDFFRKNIKTEETIMKSNKEGMVAVSVLEAFIGGAMVLGTLSGIFTVPTFLAVSIPGLFGITMLKELKNSIKDSKERIENLKKLEVNGVNASRNHERHKKVEELKEQKSKELKKNNKFTKIMLAGIGAFALGGFAPVAAALATPLMVGGYGTMLYGMYKFSESGEAGRNLQKRIDKLNDSIAVANINPRFIVTSEDEDEELNNEKANNNKKQNIKVNNKRHEAIVDEYIEKLAKNPHYEDTERKTK